jgi:hypothetical protein
VVEAKMYIAARLKKAVAVPAKMVGRLFLIKLLNKKILFPFFFELCNVEHNRDFLYVTNRTTQKNVIEKIHHLLYHVETIAFLSSCVEIIDFNKFKVIRKKHLIEQTLRQPYLKPFQFICNLN